MRRFIIAPPVKNAVLLWIFEGWNRWAQNRAKRYAYREAIEQNKAMYGSQMFGSIMVYSSKEKRNINRGMAKGDKMNHAQVLNWSLFLIMPDQARKAKEERLRKRLKKVGWIPGHSAARKKIT